MWLEEMVVNKIMVIIRISGEEIKEINGEETSHRIKLGEESSPNNSLGTSQRIIKSKLGVESDQSSSLGISQKMKTNGEVFNQTSLKTNGAETSQTSFKAISGAGKCRATSNSGAAAAKSRTLS